MTPDTAVPAGPVSSGPAEAPAKRSSRLQELTAEFHQQVADPRLFKRLPAVSGRLVAEYRVLSAKEIQAALRSDDEVEQNQDMLIASLVALHAHDPKHAQADKRGLVDLRRWLEIDAVSPLKFDQRLTSALELPDGTSREIVGRMFNDNEIAQGAQAAQVMAWMTDTSEESLQDFIPGS